MGRFRRRPGTFSSCSGPWGGGTPRTRAWPLGVQRKRSQPACASAESLPCAGTELVYGAKKILRLGALDRLSVNLCHGYADGTCRSEQGRERSLGPRGRTGFPGEVGCKELLLLSLSQGRSLFSFDIFQCARSWEPEQRRQ